MGKSLYNYYVAYFTDHYSSDCVNSIAFVTGIDRRDHVFYTKPGGRALKFSLSGAKDMVFGMMANGYNAFVVTAPTCVECFNPDIKVNDDVDEE